MATIPPLARVLPARTTVQRPPQDLSWVTFNLLFVLAISGLLNIVLVLRLALR